MSNWNMGWKVEQLFARNTKYNKSVTEWHLPQLYFSVLFTEKSVVIDEI